MSTFGLMGLIVAFAAGAISIIALIVGQALHKSEIGPTISWAGRLAAVVTFVALTVSCAVLVVCFLTDNYSIQYVVDEHVTTEGALGVLYRISGLWAGRAGSLLFWAWLISLFGAIVSVRRMGDPEPLDNMATLVIQAVALAFVSVTLFSEDNMPFTLTASTYLNSNGTLTTTGQLHGMNSLLQHWAMAIHPPTLFIGYAGLTVPFAYGIAACIVNKPDKEWVLRSERFALVAWLFLTIGIGLGSVWAYVCLGWGGYWGWDPVENASLLSWLVAVALIHSFTLYKTRGVFKCWAVMCAALAFAFCIVGTFISRSGLVQSVHAFEGDPVSLALFGALIIASVVVGALCCILRRKSFAPSADAAEAESMVSKDGAYFINNVVMVFLAVLLAYLTIAQALPSWMPFGGQSVQSGTYEILARPIGVVYMLMMAACPLLGWRKTEPAMFFKHARIPGICAIVLFVLLAVYWALVFVPAYNDVVAAGGSIADAVLEQGPAVYYNGLALVGLLVASLLFFNSGYQLVRVVRGSGAHAQDKGRLKGKVARLGSCVSHLAMAVILVGLIGSEMYKTEVSDYMAYDKETNTASETFQIKDYELVFKDAGYDVTEDGLNANYWIKLDAYKDGSYLGEVTPSITLVMTTQQQKYNAAVVSLPNEDLFVVYQGVSSEDGGILLDVRVNPMISVLWVGFGLLCLGMLLALLGRRRPRALGAPAAAAKGADGSSDGDKPASELPESASYRELVDASAKTAANDEAVKE